MGLQRRFRHHILSIFPEDRAAWLAAQFAVPWGEFKGLTPGEKINRLVYTVYQQGELNRLYHLVGAERPELAHHLPPLAALATLDWHPGLTTIRLRVNRSTGATTLNRSRRKAPGPPAERLPLLAAPAQISAEFRLWRLQRQLRQAFSPGKAGALSQEQTYRRAALYRQALLLAAEVDPETGADLVSQYDVQIPLTRYAALFSHKELQQIATLRPEYNPDLNRIYLQLADRLRSVVHYQRGSNNLIRYLVSNRNEIDIISHLNRAQRRPFLPATFIDGQLALFLRLGGRFEDEAAAWRRFLSRVVAESGRVPDHFEVLLFLERFEEAAGRARTPAQTERLLFYCIKLDRLDTLTAALPIAADFGSQRLLNRIHTRIGDHHQRSGRFEQAFDHYQAADNRLEGSGVLARVGRWVDAIERCPADHPERIATYIDQYLASETADVDYVERLSQFKRISERGALIDQPPEVLTHALGRVSGRQQQTVLEMRKSFSGRIKRETDARQAGQLYLEWGMLEGLVDNFQTAARLYERGRDIDDAVHYYMAADLPGEAVRLLRRHLTTVVDALKHWVAAGAESHAARIGRLNRRRLWCLEQLGAAFEAGHQPAAAGPVYAALQRYRDARGAYTRAGLWSEALDALIQEVGEQYVLASPEFEGLVSQVDGPLDRYVALCLAGVRQTDSRETGIEYLVRLMGRPESQALPKSLYTEAHAVLRRVNPDHIEPFKPPSGTLSDPLSRFQTLYKRGAYARAVEVVKEPRIFEAKPIERDHYLESIAKSSPHPERYIRVWMHYAELQDPAHYQSSCEDRDNMRAIPYVEFRTGDGEDKMPPLCGFLISRQVVALSTAPLFSRRSGRGWETDSLLNPENYTLYFPAFVTASGMLPLLYGVRRVYFRPQLPHFMLLELAEPIDIPPFRLGFARLSRVGDQVSAWGFPTMVGQVNRAEAQIAQAEMGKVDLVRDVINRQIAVPGSAAALFELTRVAESKMSGGPVLNRMCEVIGVIGSREQLEQDGTLSMQERAELRSNSAVVIGIGPLRELLSR